MSDMPVTDQMRGQLSIERGLVLDLGRRIGFGNMMSLASEAWQTELESSKSGSDIAAFVVGPCKAFVVPCGCGGSKDCDWCCATGWLTKKVKEIKDAKPNGRIVEDDEIVRTNTYFHMERMDDDHIWFNLGDNLQFDLYAKRGKLLWVPQAESWDAISHDEEIEE